MANLKKTTHKGVYEIKKTNWVAIELVTDINERQTQKEISWR